MRRRQVRSRRATTRELPRSGRMVRLRVASILAFCGFSMFYLGGRLFYVQIVRGNEYRTMALEQRMYPVPVDAKRGAIFDRRGRELAVSVSADSVYAVPADVDNKPATARKVAATLGLPEREVLDKLNQRSATVWISRKAEPEAVQKLRQLRLKGIGFTERGQRFYPKESLAAHVLGIAGIDNQGLEGVEVEYDSHLSGVRGQIVAERDAAGREIPEGTRKFVPPRDGCDLYLTLDEVIQYVAERELDRAMAETRSQRGMVIVMEPRTGRILAMASRPTYNPNHYNDYPASFRRNIACADSYEPGSTFKIVTASAALEEGAVKPQERFYDPGFVTVEDRKVRCWRPGGHGTQTFVEAAENSCNPVFAMLGLRLGPDRFYSYIKAFGFGERTGIDYPGEAPGIVMPKSKMGPVETANISFGQGISVTALQLACAMAAIANGGLLMKPALVDKIVAPDGTQVKEFHPEPVRQVVSSETARELSLILESVVVNGSGVRAQIPGYRIAGKTGTAQKPEQGRYGEKRVASFVGFAPVEDPRVACLVVLDEPDCGITYGGVLAAPLFRAIVYDALRYLEVKPSTPVAGDEEEAARPGGEAGARESTAVPDVRGMSFDDARAILDERGLKSRPEGSGEVVVDQVPKPEARVGYGTGVVLYLEQGRKYNGRESGVMVPNLTGMSLKDAAVTLGSLGLSMRASGSGWVASQDPKPGVVVAQGDVVTLLLSPDETRGQKGGGTDRR